MGWFWFSVTVALVGVLAFRLVMPGLFYWLLAKIPLIHRGDPEVMKENTLVTVVCSANGRVAAAGASREVAQCAVKRLVSVPNKKLRVGCCGNYSVAQALYLAHAVGADPLCGGGIKYEFLPRRWERRLQTEHAQVLERREQMSGFVLRQQDGDIWWGTLFMGDAAQIAKYFDFSIARLVPAVLTPA